MDHSIIRSQLVHAEQSQTFQRWASRPVVDLEPPAGGRHLYLTEYLEEIGYADLPHVVSRMELDRFIAGGEVALMQPEPELLRGVSKTEYAEQFRHAKLYVGSGACGNGIYTDIGRYAAHRDYAAVRIEAHESLMLVLNRTALRVQEEPHDPT